MERLMSQIGLGQNDNRVGGGDSFVDRLSCSYTVLLLTLFAIIVTTRQWLGEVPIACWCPAHFTEEHCQYTNNVCFTRRTYYLPLDKENVPKDDLGKEYISYYQWVALVFICQACLFYMPRFIWSMLNKKSGIAVSTITDASIQCQKSLNGEDRAKVVKYMIRNMGRYLLELSRQSLLSTRVKGYWVCLYGNYLFMSYMFIKLIYLTNIILQLFYLNIFLGMDFHNYGLNVLNQMRKGETWQENHLFPRVTLCDFAIRQMGNIQHYTVQCSLPLNLLNEKLYIFVWFWFLFVFIATVISFLKWCVVSLYIPQELRYVKARLIAMDHWGPGDKYENLSAFVRTFLRRDGLLLIRLVSKNSSDMVSAELLGGLWQYYKRKKHKIQRLQSYGGKSARVPDVVEIMHERLHSSDNELYVDTDDENKQSVGGKTKPKVTTKPVEDEPQLTVMPADDDNTVPSRSRRSRRREHGSNSYDAGTVHSTRL